MKKAYVKPVFMACEFESTVNVAACSTPSNIPNEIWKGDYVCSHNDAPGHVVGHGGSAPVNDYWGYATNGTNTTGIKPAGEIDVNESSLLFTNSQIECDFVWNSVDGPVGIWQDENGKAISDMNDRKVGISEIFYGIATDFMNFFRGNGSGCGDIVVDEGTPFS